MWDIETGKIISDLSGQALSGYVRCVLVDNDRKLMITASDKTIAVWNMINMTVVMTLKGHKDDIRCLYMHNGILYSGGKGTGNTPSLFVWDLRSLQPFDEKERNQEVFSIVSCVLIKTSNMNTLYYGTRGHQVRSMNLETNEVMPAFDNPHFDAVTSVAANRGYLVSGSRDKCLKLWNIDTPYNPYLNAYYGHKDQINSIIRKQVLIQTIPPCRSSTLAPRTAKSKQRS